MSFVNSPPEFFRAYVPDHSSDELHVPPPFVSHLHVPLPTTVILRSRRCRSKTWEVKVKHEAHGVYFRRGWRIFVRDFSLQFSDLITFRFDGDRTFLVTVFGKNMIEKKIAGDEEIDLKKDLYSDDDEEDEEIDVNKYLYSINNPFFGTKVKVRRGRSHGILPLPLSILKDLKARGLKMDDNVILRDWKGKEWNHKINHWTDKRVLISRWNAFCEETGLKTGDRCVIELILQQGEELVSLVHVHAVRNSSFIEQQLSVDI